MWVLLNFADLSVFKMDIPYLFVSDFQQKLHDALPQYIMASFNQLPLTLESLITLQLSVLELIWEGIFRVMVFITLKFVHSFIFYSFDKVALQNLLCKLHIPNMFCHQEILSPSLRNFSIIVSRCKEAIPRQHLKFYPEQAGVCSVWNCHVGVFSLQGKQKTVIIHCFLKNFPAYLLYLVSMGGVQKTQNL